MKFYKKKHKREKGFTLVELALIVPLIAIITLISVNLIFFSYKSTSYVNHSFDTSEDIRIFLNSIQKEANQAKKAVDNEKIGPFNRISSREIYIYTDVNGENPELIRYRLKDNRLLRDIKKTNNTTYPYEFKDKFIDEKVVLSNIVNEDIFGEVESLKEEKNTQEGEDFREKVKMTIEISTGKNNTPIKINTYLVSKSRAKFD